MKAGIMMTFDLEALRERVKAREKIRAYLPRGEDLKAVDGDVVRVKPKMLTSMLDDTATLLAEVDRLLNMTADPCDVLMESVEGDDDESH
jgi:hypothetical protein